MCRFPFVYSSRSNKCVCAEGYRRRGGRCERGTTNQPEQRPGNARIQRCLNFLGYEAGRPDGVPGPQTRRAWQQFRRDQGLSHRPFEALDRAATRRLFRICNKERRSPERDFPPLRSPERVFTPPLPPETGFDPDIPQAVCASRRLFNRIKRARGDTGDLGICGIDCIPASSRYPRGAERDSAVPLCGNCIQIGDLGFVCTGRNRDWKR